MFNVQVAREAGGAGHRAERNHLAAADAVPSADLQAVACVWDGISR